MPKNLKKGPIVHTVCVSKFKKLSSELWELIFSFVNTIEILKNFDRVNHDFHVIASNPNSAQWKAAINSFRIKYSNNKNIKSFEVYLSSGQFVNTFQKTFHLLQVKKCEICDVKKQQFIGEVLSEYVIIARTLTQLKSQRSLTPMTPTLKNSVHYALIFSYFEGQHW